jgi:hypothetical protein
VNHLAPILRDEFGQKAKEAAEILNKIGQSADEIAFSLRDFYNHTPEQAAEILNELKKTTDEITSSLKNIYKKTEAETAEILIGLGKTGDEIRASVVKFFTLGKKEDNQRIIDLIAANRARREEKKKADRENLVKLKTELAIKELNKGDKDREAQIRINNMFEESRRRIAEIEKGGEEYKKEYKTADDETRAKMRKKNEESIRESMEKCKSISEAAKKKKK